MTKFRPSTAMDPETAKRRRSAQQSRYQRGHRYISEWLLEHHPKIYRQALAAAEERLAALGPLPGDDPTNNSRKAS
jgi:hypothetical protein